MKKITLIVALFLGFIGTSQVTVGNGTTTNTYLPIESCYGYTYSEQIFLASEIDASGNITSVSFYLDAATSTADFSDSVGWTVFLGHTTKTSYASNTDWVTSTGLTESYAGDVTFPAEDNLFTITLDTPFSYNGTDNLVVAVYENTPGYNCSMAWRTTPTSDNKSIQFKSDSENPDPAAPPTATLTVSNRTNITFGGITQSCPTPSDLAVTNITTSTADLSWTENGTATDWNVEVVAAGTTPSGIATDSNVANPFSKTGLSASINYEFYVQTDCGGDLSGWVGPFIFAMECAAFTVPYTENFDTTATGTTTAPTVPNCWSFIDGGSGYGYVSASGVNSFYMTNGSDLTNDYILVSPETTDLTSGLNRVSFDVDGSTGQELIVGTLTDAADGTTFTAIETITLATNDYESYSVIIPAGTDSYLAFKHGLTGTYDGYYLDNISVEPVPSCLEPSDLTVSNIALTSADLGWTENGTATIWNIEIVDITAGDSVTGMATESGVSNPYTATGLASSNSYEYYVQADCGGGDTSVWIGPMSFSTACSYTDVPFMEDFETGAACGSIINEGTGNAWEVNTTTTTTYGFTGNHLRYTYNGASAADTWFFTQGINLTAGQNYTVTYDYGGTGTTYPEKLKVAYGTSATAAGMTTELADYPTVNSNVPINEILTFIAPADGVYYIGFQAYSDADELYLHLDNITVDFTLAVGNFENEAAFTYYPNPVKNTLTLNAQKTIEQVAMYNMLGQEVLRATPNTLASDLDMSNLQTGTYFVKVTIANVTETIRVIKQ